MKKVFSLLITLAMIISTVAVPMSASADTTAWDGTTIDTEWVGTGTETDPYLIGSEAELAGLSEKVWSSVNNGTGTITEGMESVVSPAGNQYNLFMDCYNVYSNTYFKLTADIDLGNKPWTPIGRHSARFNGNFDGAGHVIKNVSITEDYIGIGLFGATGKNTKISNLGLEDFSASVSSASTPKDVTEFGERADKINYIWGSGAMVGIVGGGTYENCYTKNVSFINANASVGNPSGGVGEAGFGGFVGNDIVVQDNTSVAFKNCYVINVESETADHSAGFWAKNVKAEAGGSWSTECQNSKIDNCYVAGDINLKTRHDIRKSGFLCNFALNENDIDWALPVVTNCYTTAEVNKYDILEEASTKQDIIDGMSGVNGFVADNAQNPINDGYPVLAWQADWIWNGTVATGFAGGSGTENDPYLISNGAQLAYLADTIWNAEGTTDTSLKSTMKNWRISVDGSATQNSYDLWGVYHNTYFKLTADIDLNNVEWKPIGRNRARFAGIFDGDGHVVKNVKITKVYNGTGFFGATAHTAVVKNLGLEKVDIDVACSNTSEDFKAFGNNEDKWHNGAGALVGKTGGGTYENCYVKDVDYLNSVNTGEGGFGGMFGQYASTHQHNVWAVKNCYVMNVTAKAKEGVSAFANDYHNNGLANPQLSFENCYVGGTVNLTLYSGGAAAGFASIPNKVNTASKPSTVDKCYTVAAIGSDTELTTQSTQADIVAGLKNVDGWYEDNSVSPINGGYPVLDWQNTWKKPYEVKAIGTADGNVTAVTLKKNADITGTVIVAVYSGERFLGAVTATAADGEVTLNAPIAVASGNTVKVFVWDSTEALSPLAKAYSTTI